MPEIAQTADHALRILEELGLGAALTPAELSERLDLNRSVVHRLLTTLSQRGFVLRRGSHYLPGPTLLRLSATLEPDLRAIAAPLMRELSAQIQESLVLHIPDDVHAVVLHQAVYAGHILQVSHQIGAKHSLTQGASGRAILAFSEVKVQRRALAAAAQPEQVERSLASARELGFALSHDELQDGVHGLAVPLLDERSRVLGSLAVIVPTGRAIGLEGRVPELKQAAATVAERLAAVSRGDA